MTNITPNYHYILQYIKLFSHHSPQLILLSMLIECLYKMENIKTYIRYDAFNRPKIPINIYATLLFDNN